MAVMQAAAFPGLYNALHDGCTPPRTGFAGHGAPVPSPLITFRFAKDGETVTEWEPQTTYLVTVTGYNGTVNNWVHASRGARLPLIKSNAGVVSTGPAPHMLLGGRTLLEGERERERER